MSKQFSKEYPTALEDLWLVDEGFLPLVSGVSSWVPIPSVRRSVKARDRMIPILQTWANDSRRSLTEEIMGNDFSDVSEVMRQEIKL